MATVWILPLVTLIVASSTGGLLGSALIPHSTHYALVSTAVSLTSLIVGLSLALMILTVYLTRLILYGPPDVSLILSAFVALGPLGQGGFSLLVNGENLSKLLSFNNESDLLLHPLTGRLIYSACFCGAWVLWSMGVGWVLISVSSLWAVARRASVPFSLSYWGTIFPNGVFALLSIQLGKVLNSPFFHYFGAIWSSKASPFIFVGLLLC
jgi:tellurite resistance protein TehA-like permease